MLDKIIQFLKPLLFMIFINLITQLQATCTIGASADYTSNLDGIHGIPNQSDFGINHAGNRAVGGKNGIDPQTIKINEKYKGTT